MLDVVGHEHQMEGGVLSLLPIILGADLLWTGRRQVTLQQAHPF
jgi:hypothetical protein